MIRDTTNMKNRRRATRRNELLEISYSHAEGTGSGVVINLSETGARLLVRQPLPRKFQLTLPLGHRVELEAERVWEQAPMMGGGRILGVRFRPDEGQKSALQSWVEH